MMRNRFSRPALFGPALLALAIAACQQPQDDSNIAIDNNVNAAEAIEADVETLPPSEEPSTPSNSIVNGLNEADGSSTPGGAAAQARRCFAIILGTIEELGGTPADVVRTRMFITDPADADAIGAVHGEIFRDIRPASTMVVVSALLRPEWRIEIEAEALVGDDTA